MKDVFGFKLTIGDTVATNRDGYLYELVVCKVVKITPMKVKLRHGDDEFYKYPKQVARNNY